MEGERKVQTRINYGWLIADLVYVLKEEGGELYFEQTILLVLSTTT